MSFAFRLFLIAGITWLVGWQLPQYPVWPVVLGAFLVGLLLSRGHRRSLFIRRKPQKAFAFWAGLLGVGVVWGLLTWRIHVANEGLLTEKMLALLTQGQPDWPGAVLVAATALMGGLLGGLAAMTGNLLGEAIKT